MLARLLLVAAILFAPYTVRADVSPEYYQLLSDINGRLKVLAPSLTRGPVCAPQMVQMAKEGLQGNLFSSAATKVVVEPLETGAKVAAGALGVESLAITTYSLVRCGMNESSPEGFAKCALGEGLGYAGGEALTAAGVGDLSGAVAGAAWDKAYGAMRSAIEDYGKQTETVEWTTSGTCDVTVLAHWNKRGRPGAEGGKITLSARATNCKCATGNSLKQGTLRFTVPVHYDRAGASQPGWRAGTPSEYMLEAQCCSQSRPDGRVFLYDPAGQLRAPSAPRTEPVRPPTSSSSASPTSATPSAPGTRIQPPAAPPAPLWSVENPCPACEPFKNLMDEHVLAAAGADQQAARLQSELAENQAQQEAARKRIAALQQQLGSREGTGASAYNPETGFTTESMTQADGSVLIVVKDQHGNEIERRTRDPRDAVQIRGKIAQEEEALQQLQQAAAQLLKDVDYQHAVATKHRKLAQDALQALKDCLIRECNQDPERISRMSGTAGLASLQQVVRTPHFIERAPRSTPPKEDILSEIEMGETATAPNHTVPTLPEVEPSYRVRFNDSTAVESILSPKDEGVDAPRPPSVSCSFPAVQPVTIGPKETFGNSDEKKALEAGKAVFGILGGLLGGGGGGGGGDGIPFGMAPGGSDSGPDLVSNPIDAMQRYTLPGAETVIKAGARYRDDGKLLVSVEVDESPDDGVVHQVELQRLTPNADGGCTFQVMRPGQWLHYGIYEKWWTKLRIQTFANDGSGWKKTGDTGWMDWGSGTNVIETGRIPASEIPNTGWGSMGADRAMGGPRAAGALFDPGKPAVYEQPVPERFVVHVSRPESDPVITVPFALYPVYWSDGTVALTDQAPAPFVFNGPPPRLPIGGGMTQIDPPSTPPPREDILNEIDYVPIRQ